MLTKIKAFLAQYNVTTHSIAALLVTFGSFYTDNQAFHDWVDTTAVAVYGRMPHWMAGLVLALVPVALKYWKGLSVNGRLTAAAEAATERPAAAKSVVASAAAAPNVSPDIHVAIATSKQ